jgi:hypothetical protein
VDEGRLREIEKRRHKVSAWDGQTRDYDVLVEEDVPELIAEVRRLRLKEEQGEGMQVGVSADYHIEVARERRRAEEAVAEVRRLREESEAHRRLYAAACRFLWGPEWVTPKEQRALAAATREVRRFKMAEMARDDQAAGLYDLE